MFDRVLLILLLLLLPIGIVVSRVITGEMVVGKPAAVAEQDKKIEAIMQKLNQSEGGVQAPTAAGDFNITGVMLATDSGKLKVFGVAPQSDPFVWVWTAANGLKTASIASASAGATKVGVWSGPVVIKPAAGGPFTVEVDVSAYSGVVEVRLEQGQSAKTVRYDLVKQVQLN